MRVEHDFVLRVAQRASINFFQNFHGTASGPPTESQSRKCLILFTIRPSSYNARDQRAYSPLVHSFIPRNPRVSRAWRRGNGPRLLGGVFTCHLVLRR
jgi:hypothetical protein